eukprot:CAMPEP_0194398928 /NCGR_PEP_ID=MMETSP0174-20130528/126378_1 /TAXON_ID=216777 /ORGANISM="Proboscia alata, Strain PI-D3" /LENGTH=140 /DNA_ID=CAMNT_0039195281 /DNA_START=54 /DNA_END=476 /DNA_ORIENTATION=-
MNTTLMITRAIDTIQTKENNSRDCNNSLVGFEIKDLDISCNDLLIENRSTTRPSELQENIETKALPIRSTCMVGTYDLENDIHNAQNIFESRIGKVEGAVVEKVDETENEVKMVPTKIKAAATDATEKIVEGMKKDSSKI